MNRLGCIASLVTLVLTLGCQENARDDINVKLTVEPSPPRMGMARITLDVRDGEKPVEGALLKLEGNMSHAGMKPVFAEARELKDGKYQADLEFTMAGDWFILVEGKLADGKKFSRTIDVKGVKPQ